MVCKIITKQKNKKNKKMIIGIIGYGFVGKATSILKSDDIKLLIYDKNKDICEPKDIKIEDMNKCEIIFISVPTPMDKDGKCYLDIIYSVLDDLKNINYKGIIVLRSTVPVGTCDSLNINFMPEFLTEKNFENDFINNKEWIFGLQNKKSDKKFIKKITKLFTLSYKNNKIKYNNLNFVMNKEAEMIKMFKNCYLATKVSFCNEIYEFCKLKEINYDKVRELACCDERIQLSHTNVPGHDGKFGFGGTCFPKDTSSLNYEMNKVGMKSYVLNAAIERNNNVDREEMDWKKDKGRASV